jgi:hypothetical protein
MNDPAQMLVGQFVDPISYQRVEEQGGCPARFTWETVEDEVASAEAGRPIYKQREFIEIIVPGDPDNRPKRAVRDGDAKMYPAAWKAFQAAQVEVTVGTPLEVWPLMTRSAVLELAHFRIRTVEQLAEVPDSGLEALGPHGALRAQARDWLALAGGVAPLHAARAEAEALRKEVEELRAEKAKAPTEVIMTPRVSTKHRQPKRARATKRASNKPASKKGGSNVKPSRNAR